MGGSSHVHIWASKIPIRTAKFCSTSQRISPKNYIISLTQAAAFAAHFGTAPDDWVEGLHYEDHTANVGCFLLWPSRIKLPSGSACFEPHFPENYAVLAVGGRGFVPSFMGLIRYVYLRTFLSYFMGHYGQMKKRVGRERERERRISWSS